MQSKSKWTFSVMSICEFNLRRAEGKKANTIPREVPRSYSSVCLSTHSCLKDFFPLWKILQSKIECVLFSRDKECLFISEETRYELCTLVEITAIVDVTSVFPSNICKPMLKWRDNFEFFIFMVSFSFSFLLNKKIIKKNPIIFCESKYKAKYCNLEVGSPQKTPICLLGGWVICGLNYMIELLNLLTW